MRETKFNCQFCGYVPRSQEQPGTGAWYCPKCGKRTTIRVTVPPPKRTKFKRSQPPQISRDRVSSQIYSELTQEKHQNFGLKDPYLNPKIQPIKAKIRKKVQIFSPSTDED